MTRRKIDPANLMTLGEASRLYCFSLSTIHNWISSGKLPAIVVGDVTMPQRKPLVLLDCDVITEFLEQRYGT